MKILVSGFEAFGGETINPTHLLISELRASRVIIPADSEVRAVLLPVGFATAFQVLENEIRGFRPDAVLALGQGGGRDSIELERIAVNLMDADQPDNEGWQPQDEKIDSDGEMAYLSTLPLKDLKTALTAANIPVRISNSAGLYVCNFLFYRLQHLLRADDSSVKSGFVHVPYLPEQVIAKTNVPSMPLATQVRALEIMLNHLRLGHDAR